jgi:hypothetical protein
MPIARPLRTTKILQGGKQLQGKGTIGSPPFRAGVGKHFYARPSVRLQGLGAFECLFEGFGDGKILAILDYARDFGLDGLIALVNR